MTSFAFIFGVVPLVVAAGAGAEMRRSLGTAVFSGMLGVTLFGIFLTPVFFYVIQGLGETRLFAAAATRWVGSALLGGLVGPGIGFLLAQLGVVRLSWALAGRRLPRDACSRWPSWAFIGVIAAISRRLDDRARPARQNPVRRAEMISRDFALLHRSSDLRHRPLASSSCWRAAWPSSRCRWRSIPR